MSTLTIWKFLVASPGSSGRVAITIPAGAKYLSAQRQAGHLMVWALVNPDNHQESHTLLITGTGRDIPESDLFGFRYLDTVQDDFGYVWHVWVPA